MHRIDNSTALAALDAPSAPGPNPDYYFTGGDPGMGVPATVFEAEWANMLQEEVAKVVLDAGASLDKADRTQLSTAIQVLIASKAVAFTSNIVTATDSGTAQYVVDDTVPAVSELDNYADFDTVHTPKSATNRLKITVTVFVSTTALAGSVTVGLFQDAISAALDVGTTPANVVNVLHPLTFIHEMAAGTTSPITFKIGIAGSAAATYRVNGVSGARVHGGASASSVLIEEYAA